MSFAPVTPLSTTAVEPAQASGLPAATDQARVVLSFDVEEHDRIEAASGLCVPESLKAHYSERLGPSTEWLLDRLGERDIRATFFVVGQIAKHNPRLVRAIHSAGHEVASHSWDHRRVLRFNPQTFREDLAQSRDALEQVTGEAVVGFRAPTFSVVRRTAWALDVLAEEGMLYDSSIYPVRHDRYGEHQAPRSPFLAQGPNAAILEIPPVTLRLLGANLPVGGGGYFRLFPLAFMTQGIRQALNSLSPPVAMLYFHPWEFDPQQQKLPLQGLSRFRTYVGIGRARHRLTNLLERYTFTRAVDVARELGPFLPNLPSFRMADPSNPGSNPPA
jgi:polysaccharide deacetylase family protein (PEP-CTERM system associated)